MAAPRFRPAAALAFAAAALSFAGCSPFSDYSPLYVTAFRNIEVKEGGCGAGSVSIVRGTLASKFGAEYWVGVELRSELDQNGDPEVGRENSNILYVDTATVTYTSPDKSIDPPPPDAVLPIGIVVPPNADAKAVVPLLGGAEAEKAVKGKSGNLQATLVFSGASADGSSFKSTPVKFPFLLDGKLELCTGPDGAPVDPAFACGMKGTPDVASCPKDGG